MFMSGIINTNLAAFGAIKALTGTQGGFNAYLQQMSIQTQSNGLNQSVSETVI